MNIDAYIKRVDAAVAELADVRRLLINLHDDADAGRCAPVVVNPTTMSSCRPSVQRTGWAEIEAEFDQWLKSIADRFTTA